MRYWRCERLLGAEGFTVGRTYTTDMFGCRFVDDNGFMYGQPIETLLGVYFEEMSYA